MLHAIFRSTWLIAVNVQRRVREYWLAFMKARGLIYVGLAVAGTAFLHQMWRQHHSDVTTGVVSVQDRFQFYVLFGDGLFFAVFIWLLFVAVARLTPGRPKQILKVSAIVTMILFMVWKWCAIYLLVPTAI